MADYEGICNYMDGRKKGGYEMRISANIQLGFLWGLKRESEEEKPIAVLQTLVQRENSVGKKEREKSVY